MLSAIDIASAKNDPKEEKKHFLKSAINAAPPSSDPRVPGNIHRPEFFSFWKDTLKADPYVLDILKDGFKLPFKTPPVHSIEPNNKSALENSDFLLSELLRLEKLGCISRVDEQPFITLPCSLVWSNKLRLVVDASRGLNPFLEDKPVKLTSLEKANDSVQQNSWGSTQDLDSGYYHIMIHPDFRKFLGVHFVLPDGRTLFWVWNVLFLGCKVAVHIFTKMLKPHLAFLISNGISADLFIDDERIVAESKELCILHTDIARKALKMAGWIEKLSKFKPPSQRFEFLGLENDLQTLRYFVPDRKKQNIRKMIASALASPFVHVKYLASILGKLQAIYLAVGRIVRFCTRFCFNVIALAPNWKCWVKLTDFAKWELTFLSDNLDDFDGHSMSFMHKIIPVSRLMFASDASAEGAFVYRFHIGEFDRVIAVDDCFVRKQFSLAETERSSTFRELLCFAELYENYGERLRGKTIVHFTDSLNAKRILEFGSRKAHLHKLAFIIFSFCHRFNITLVVEWLPREHPVISLADEGSKTWDSSDFSLDETSFNFIQETFGNFSIDLFASGRNHKTPRFYSLHFSARALAQNAFTQNWNGEFAFILPPPICISAIVRKIITDQAEGVLVVPFWTASKFMLSISSDGRSFNNLFVGIFRFKPYFSKGDDVISKTFCGFTKFPMLALKFDGKVLNPLSPNWRKPLSSTFLV